MTHFSTSADTSKIDMIISEKESFQSPQEFFQEVITFLDREIYPGCGIDTEYFEFRLKEGSYLGIIEQRISLMNKKDAEIKIQNAIRTYRIKRKDYDPLSDEFIIETNDEYIAFLWTITE